MAAPIILESDVRAFLKDKPELNPLIDGVRFSTDEIQRAMIFAVDFFNTLPPPTGNAYTIESFPYAYMLLIGTSGYLLRGAAVNQASNHLTYSADGVQVDDFDKAPIFSKLGSDLWSEYKEMAQSAKISQNIANAYGGVNSEYIYRAR